MDIKFSLCLSTSFKTPPIIDIEGVLVMKSTSEGFLFSVLMMGKAAVSISLFGFFHLKNKRGIIWHMMQRGAGLNQSV